MSIKLTSTAFNNESSIPAKHTGDGHDVSPALAWSDFPENAGSFALICDDPDAPVGTWVHWVIFNIPAHARALPGGVPTTGTLQSGAVQGKNDFGNIGYGGPAPPPGKAHRYFFKLYCLDGPLDLAPGATKKQLLSSMEGHLLAQGQLMGRYKR